MAKRFATRIGAIRANRFAEKKLFSERLSDSREVPQKRDSQKGAQFGNAHTIRANQAIRVKRFGT